MRYYKYLLVGLLVAYSGFAMQPQENEDYLSSLPADLRAQIINYLTSGKTLEEVINNIRSLSRVNKSHYYLINDAQVTRYLISTIAKRFNINQLSVALTLGTLGSQDWANKYISEKQNDANFKQELAIVLQHAIKDNDLKLVKYIISKMPSLLNEYVLDPANGYKRTPLVQAIRYGRASVVDYLLRQSADFNLKEIRELGMMGVPPGTIDRNWNPDNLTLAVTYANEKNLEIVKLLLNAGIAKTITENNWKYIINQARDMERLSPGILKLLQDAFAKFKR